MFIRRCLDDDVAATEVTPRLLISSQPDGRTDEMTDEDFYVKYASLYV